MAVSQGAADGLMLAADDFRFDVRFQSGRSLAAILESNPGIRIDRQRVEEMVLPEAAVGRPIWEAASARRHRRRIPLERVRVRQSL